MQKLSGLICVAVGSSLIYWGYHMAHALEGRINSFIGGAPGDKPMLLYVSGVILVVVGLGQMAIKGK